MNFDLNPLIQYLDSIETLVSPARHLPADKATVITGGYGETSPALVHEGMIVPESLAAAWRDSRLAGIMASIQHTVPFDLTQGQMIACMDFCYNCGFQAFKSSTLLKFILAKKFILAGLEFAKWDMANGKHLAGLAKRRHVEQNWFSA